MIPLYGCEAWSSKYKYSTLEILSDWSDTVWASSYLWDQVTFACSSVMNSVLVNAHSKFLILKLYVIKLQNEPTFVFNFL